MIESILFLVATITIFLFWMKMQNLSGWLYLNPVVMSMITIISLLIVLDIDYQRYMKGGRFIDYLIEPAVVALGYPLYKQMHIIRKQWRELGFVCVIAVVFALSFSTILARLLGLEHWVVKSLVTLNVTTPIAMETSLQMGGEPSLAACFVLIAGFSGCTIGWQILKLLRFTDERGVGLAIGSMSHALGTAVISRYSYLSSAYSSTALILCAIFAAIIAPILVPNLLDL